MHAGNPQQLPVPATLAGSSQHTLWHSPAAHMHVRSQRPRTLLFRQQARALSFCPFTNLALLQQVEVLGHSGQHGAVGRAVRHAHLRYAWQYSVNEGCGRAAMKIRQWRAAERCGWMGGVTRQRCQLAQRLRPAGSAHLNLLQVRQHIQLGQVDVGQPVDPARIMQMNGTQLQRASNRLGGWSVAGRPAGKSPAPMPPAPPFSSLLQAHVQVHAHLLAASLTWKLVSGPPGLPTHPPTHGALPLRSHPPTRPPTHPRHPACHSAVTHLEAYLRATRSSQPMRRGRPVVVPYSAPTSRSSSARSPKISVG